MAGALGRWSAKVVIVAVAAATAAACGSGGSVGSVFTSDDASSTVDDGATVDATADAPSQNDGPSLFNDAATKCVPKTCAQLAYTCGKNSDGCGGVIDCGGCTDPQFCGGGGYSKCGGSNGLSQDGAPMCTPTTCKVLGYDCGFAGDGCGGQLDCGSCQNPQFCGGGGFDVCGGNNGLQQDGAPMCTPTTCQKLGFNCGPAGDGCGGLLQCGSCAGNQTCGGGGQASVCGNINCTGLCNNQVACDGGATTTITGRVVAGTIAQYGTPDPVPGVLVYVPNAPLKAFSTGVQCSQCGADVSGNPLVQTTTGIDGTFVITNMPVGNNIPVVIQLGRWRREVTFNVPSCATTAVGDIHMPRTKAEGDIPFTAIDTGNVDAIECVLLKMGVDQGEFTKPGVGGRMEMYTGNGANAGAGTPAETTLVNSLATLDEYDQVFFPCWGGEFLKTGAQQTNVIDYTSNGGRVFSTHYSYTWLFNDAPFSGTANWAANTNSWNALTGAVDQSSQQGQTFAGWLNVIGLNPASLNIAFPREDSTAVVAPTLQWIYSSSPQFPLDFSFETPINMSPQCGRVFYLDFHVTNAGTSGVAFPNECTAGPMTAQEKVLEYMIWQLAQCTPPPPPPPPCTPLTCMQQNISCGPAGDGCGNLLDCGTCPNGQTCGGGGMNGQCGYPDAGQCTPETCQQQKINCGPAGDGCGGLLDCGTCPNGQTCGGGGQNGQCGSPDAGSCKPETCAQLGINCGPAGDGCGGLLDCGTCSYPQTCGGGGQPGQCGGGSK